MRKLLFLFLILFSTIVFAGKPNLDLFGNWNTLFVNGNFGDSNWFYSIEQSDRNSTDENHNFKLAQYSNYDGIGYRFNNNHSLLIGFWYQYTQPPYSGKITQEADAYQRYSYVNDLTYGVFSLRSQLEQRNNISKNNANGPSIRYRQQLKFVYRLSGTNWSVVTSEEIMVNLNTVNWGPVAGFDQNRAFVGFGYVFNKQFNTEFGYMNQTVYRNLNSMFIDNQLSINLYVNFY